MARHRAVSGDPADFTAHESTVTPIRVFIAHRQPLIAESLRLATSSLDDMVVVGVQQTAADVEQRVIELDAHVVLLDANIDAERLIEIISGTRAVTRTLVVSDAPSLDLLYRCMMAGVGGFLIAPRDYDEIISAIRRAQLGWMVLTQQQLAELMSYLAPRVSNRGARALCDRLSEREREILIVLATGVTTEQAAGLLNISAHTVNSHVKNALRKLNARSKLAAVVMLASAGFLDGV